LPAANTEAKLVVQKFNWNDRKDMPYWLTSRNRQTCRKQTCVNKGRCHPP